jgi:transcriptional regulator GlxA family with amidase domain
MTRGFPINPADGTSPDSTPTSRPQVGMLLYPGLTLLDLLGPQTALSHVMDVHLLWKTCDEPVVTDTGIRILPTMTLTECPSRLDVLFVPGGPGMNDVMGDHDVLRFLTDRGATATWVTSVCSGSIVLGAAGLLDGYRATSHWGAVDLLPLVGAVPVTERVVTDRNRITAGGVTAGLDFGLTLIARMFDKQTALAVQLGMEYDPQPPFDAGTPSGRDVTPELLRQVGASMGDVGQEALAALRNLGYGRTPASS